MDFTSLGENPIDAFPRAKALRTRRGEIFSLVAPSTLLRACFAALREMSFRSFLIAPRRGAPIRHRQLKLILMKETPALKLYESPASNGQICSR